MKHATMNVWTGLIQVALIVYAATAAHATVNSAVAVDAPNSKMTVYVYKQGIFAFAADNHVVNAPIVAGSYDDSKKTVDIIVDATKMKVLDPGVSAGRSATVQAKMIGSDVLDVTKYPKIEFHSTSIKSIDAKNLTVIGNLTLHGQTHSVSLNVAHTDATHFRGSTMLRQSEFGITPIRIAGGTVRVKDDVKVEFEIALKTR